MTTTETRVAQKSVLAGALGLAMALAAGCSSSGGGTNTPEYDINCQSCRQNDQACTYSINCQPGSICNDPVEDLYDADKTALTCIKVVCASNADCESPKVCSLEKICNSPICQVDGDCEGGSRCLGGACGPAPNAQDVASCDIVTRGGSIRQGATQELVAVAKNANGAVLAAIEFEWSSQNPNVVAVSGRTATGGAEAGATTLTAAVVGKPSVTCTGLELVNFPNVGMNEVRVVLVSDDNGEPVGGAEVTIEAGGSMTAMSDAATGAAVFATGATVDSITVVKAGYQSVSVLAPGSKDVFLPVPKLADNTKAGGFRGVVDISATKKADIQLGIAGPSIPSNLLDFDLTSLLGDSVKTVIDAPELGLNMEEVDLPGGVLLGLGNKKFTADGTGMRCQGTTPSANELGCYLARAPAGNGAAWVLAGQLKLSQVTSIANQLSSVLGGGSSDELPIGDLLTAVLPLVRSLNHGVNAALDITEYPKVKADPAGTTDCSDANAPSYDDNCVGDYSKYEQISLAASQSLGVLSTLSVPTLPNLPGTGAGCAGAAVILSGAILPGRGVVPLGLSAGVDVLKDEPADCKVAGIKEPFGPNSPELDDGQMALSMAPAHSGIEGSSLAILSIALDPDSLTSSALQLNAIVEHVPSVAASQSIASRSYLPYPQGSVSRGMGTATLTSAITGATAVRYEIQNGDDSWLVYAPASMTSVSFPNVPSARTTLAGTGDVYVQAIQIDGDYASMWTFGSGKTLDHLIEQIKAFVVQGCTTEAGPCTQN